MSMPALNCPYEDSFVLTLRYLSPSDTSITVSSECFSRFVEVFGDSCRIEKDFLSMDCCIFNRAEKIRLLAEVLNFSRDGSLSVDLIRSERLFVSVAE